MCEIIDWMNNNQGFFMGTLTLVYVVATILICVFNNKSERATKEQVQEQRRQFDMMDRPNIDVTFEIVRDDELCLKIENIGRKMAYNVRLTINDDFIENLGDLSSSFAALNRSAFNLGIGQKWFAPLGIGVGGFEQIKKTILKIDIFYSDGKKEYKEYIEMGFSQYGWGMFYKSPFQEISKHQKEISSAIRNIEELLRK